MSLKKIYKPKYWNYLPKVFPSFVSELTWEERMRYIDYARGTAVAVCSSKHKCNCACIKLQQELCASITMQALKNSVYW